MSDLPEPMRRRVTQAPVARLATVRPDGTPHVVPVTFALEGATIVTAVDHKPKTTTKLQRLRNVEAQPAVSLVVDHYDEDWTKLWWARADGRARIVTEGPEHDRATKWLAGKYDQYRGNLPTGPVIWIAVAKWASWP